MSNETKRDVFNDLVEELASAYIALDGEGIGDELTNEDKQVYLKDYDAALPDNMPVIPKAVGEYIIDNKAEKSNLISTLGGKERPSKDMPEYVFDWLHSRWNDTTRCRQDTFARAWVLGVWRVEETGEIVKLEAEK